VGGALSFRAYKLVHGTLGFPALLNNKLEVETRLRAVDATQVPFYGVGGETIKDERVNYGLRFLNVEGNVTLKPVPWYRLGGGIGWRQIEDSEGRGSRPSIETMYTPLTAPGLGAEAQYTQAMAFTAIDWRESPGYTRRGGFYSITLNEFLDQDDRLGFRRVDLELSQFVPVLNEHWVLGVRAFAQTTTVDDGQVVPYYLLPSLGGARTHRGYGDFRFQDRHMWVLNGEYRWLPSRVLDMALFVDTGKVASVRSDLDFNNLKTAYGIGARFHGPTMTPLRLDLAHGDEGFRLHITGGLTF
jgi:outer membrane protein assembly factor BamA